MICFYAVTLVQYPSESVHPADNDKEENAMPTEKDYKVIEKATIYDLRRLIKNSDKESYTKEELCDLLDTIADAKDQE